MEKIVRASLLAFPLVGLLPAPAYAQTASG